jgi:hypothetical protein
MSVNIDQIINSVNQEAQRIRTKNATSEAKSHVVRTIQPAEIQARISKMFQTTGVAGKLNISRLELTPGFTPHSNKRYHANDLMRFHGDAFLHVSYQALLGRAADPVGWQHFHKLLMNGADKSELLVRLMRSQEAKQFGAQVAGLGLAKVRAILSRIPVVGYAFRWVWTLARLPKLVQRQNMQEAYGANQDAAITHHFNRIAQ